MAIARSPYPEKAGSWTIPGWFLVLLLVIVIVALVLAGAMAAFSRRSAGGQNTTIVEGRSPKSDKTTTIVERD